MGSTYAAGLAGATNDGLVDLRTAVYLHLRYNMYPPVPGVMVDAALEAIEAMNQDEALYQVELPEGVTYRDGRDRIEAWRVVESLHLEWFVDEVLSVGDEVDE